MTIQYPDFVVIRTPLLPFKNINNISTESLKEIVQDVAFQTAIFIASPSLYDIMMQWLKGELKDKKSIDFLRKSP
jgi:lantibiotic biosynthesis protein